ncbi:beta-ketoacyl synthase N-terminal-like domain-containing protein [Longispora sp. NPDC051575]|uniref:beta-ketoacyl synthase N-terminal-like domain-containing protein n=1 Tax=Longispora sp. NPDC051575 TaxID=3154943 RepID=UPI00341D8B6E
MKYPLAISGWSAVSPFGIGPAAFTAGVRRGVSAVATVRQESRLPTPEAGVVPDFDVRGVLGLKNTRSMDRATGIAVATVGMLLEQTGRVGGDGVGLVLGTNTGSVKSMMDFTRDSLTQDKPYFVDPARFPNTVMNCASGQCAIWHGLRGPNSTIAGGHVTGLLALQYAARLHRCGHAGTILCGAVEEFSAQRAWLEWLAHTGDAPAQPLGEGCAVFLLEAPETAREHGRAVHAEILGLEFGVAVDEHTAADVLARCVRAAVAEAGVTPADVWAVAPAGYVDGRGDAERAAIAAALAGCEVLPAVSALTGDTSAASATFQLAALLAHAEGGPAGRLGVITSVDREGLVGCALLRLG